MDHTRMMWTRGRPLRAVRSITVPTRVSSREVSASLGPQGFSRVGAHHLRGAVLPSGPRGWRANSWLCDTSHSERAKLVNACRFSLSAASSNSLKMFFSKLQRITFPIYVLM